MLNNIKGLIEKLKEVASIEDVISSYISLEKKGNNFVALCPFHDDKTPSLSVSKTKQIYKCFSCSASGDIIEFVKNFEKISLIDALKKLSSKFGINWKEYVQEQSIKKIDEKSLKLINVNNEAKDFFKYNLQNEIAKKNPDLIRFMLEKKIDEKIIEIFQLGLSSKNKNSLFNFLKAKSFNNDLLLQTGLVKLDNTKNEFYDFFIGRLIVPIFNENNECIGFSGRVIKKLDDFMPKYLNSPETYIFKKRDVLFNLNNASEHIRKQNEVIIVEGFFDVIRLHRIDLKNVVGTMGTTFSESHIILLKNLTKNFTLCLDQDSPGKTFALKLGQLLMNNNFEVSVINFENSKDIDEYILSNNIAQKEQIQKLKIDFLDFYFNETVLVNKDKPNFKNIDTFLKFLKNLGNNIKHDYYKSKIYNFYKINVVSDIEDFSNQVNVLDYDEPLDKNTKTKRKIKKDTFFDMKVEQNFESEKRVLALLITNEIALQRAIETGITFLNVSTKNLFSIFKKAFLNQSKVDSSNLENNNLFIELNKFKKTGKKYSLEEINELLKSLEDCQQDIRRTSAYLETISKEKTIDEMIDLLEYLKK